MLKYSAKKRRKRVCLWNAVSLHDCKLCSFGMERHTSMSCGQPYIWLATSPLSAKVKRGTGPEHVHYFAYKSYNVSVTCLLFGAQYNILLCVTTIIMYYVSSTCQPKCCAIMYTVLRTTYNKLIQFHVSINFVLLKYC